MALSQLVGIKDTNLCNNLTSCNRDDQYLLSSRIVGKGSLAWDQMRPELYLVNPHLEGPQLPALKMEKQ